MRSLLLLVALAPVLALAEAPEPGAAPPEAAPAAAPELPPPPPPGEAEATPAQAAEAAIPGDLPAPPPPPSSDAPWPRFGLRLEAGAPDGAVAALLFRPVPWLRLSAGPAWNYLGWGLQVGAGWTPIRWAISPTVNVDYGHYFDADATKLTDRFGSDTAKIEPLLRRVGYDYLSGQIGLEFGSQRGFAFYLRGGLSYFWTTIRGANESIANNADPGDPTVTVADPKIRAVIPSVKLGFQVFF